MAARSEVCLENATAPGDIGVWYKSYAYLVRAIAERVTRDRDDADDVTQDVFFAAWRARERFDITRDPFPWLATIARRKALTLVAGRARTTQLQPLCVATSAEEEALRNESEAWARLIVRNDLAFALRTIEDLPMRTVAERLGVPVSTAASRIGRARNRFRTELTPW